jgi:hypothetical protein
VRWHAPSVAATRERCRRPRESSVCHPAPVIRCRHIGTGTQAHYIETQGLPLTYVPEL